MVKQSMTPVLVTVLAFLVLTALWATRAHGVGPLMLELSRWGLVSEPAVAQAIDVEQGARDRIAKLANRKGGC